MNFKWDAEKNKLLKSERNVCFEDVIALIYEDKVLDIIAHPTHPNRERYPHQRMYIVRIQGYVHMVPLVKNGDEIWLKTIVPSRKMNKIYKGVGDANG
ncbi:toxin [Sulfurovum sp.]|uniref:toxin n=1 Tax=Sulfurovum sp. TaxID=1969726 RepID=UPI0025D888F9|nr:toxin [Sulfurovum sp.]